MNIRSVNSDAYVPSIVLGTDVSDTTCMQNVYYAKEGPVEREEPKLLRGVDTVRPCSWVHAEDPLHAAGGLGGCACTCACGQAPPEQEVPPSAQQACVAAFLTRRAEGRGRGQAGAHSVPPSRLEKPQP